MHPVANGNINMTRVPCRRSGEPIRSFRLGSSIKPQVVVVKMLSPLSQASYSLSSLCLCIYSEHLLLHYLTVLFHYCLYLSSLLIPTMSAGESGYYRHPCCWRYEYNCPNWVWQAGDACADCQVRGQATLTQPLKSSLTSKLRRWDGHLRGLPVTACCRARMSPPKIVLVNTLVRRGPAVYPIGHFDLIKGGTSDQVPVRRSTCRLTLPVTPASQ